MRTSNTGDESASLTTNGIKERGKQNILLSPEARSNPLGLDREKYRGSQEITEIPVVDLGRNRKGKGKKVKGISKAKNVGKQDGSSDQNGGCCPGCHIC